MELRIREIALGFLFIPVVIFYATWFNVPVTVISLIFLFGALFLFYKTELKSDTKIKLEIKTSKDILFIILSLLVILVLCLYSGFGGILYATEDWRKHNFIIEQLINNKWPVIIEDNGQTGILSYYIGAYIIPGLVGKITGGTLGYDFTVLVWGVLGLCILSLLIYDFCKGKSAKHLLFITVMLAIFTTFIVPFKMFLAVLAPDDLISGFLWFNIHGTVYFSSNFTQLQWAFAQAIPGWICTALLMCYREKRKHWALILLASFLYSAFVFIGIFFIMLFLFIYDCFKGKAKEYFSLENFLVIIPAVVMAIYFYATMAQPKDISSDMSLYVIDWSDHIISYILLECLWIPYIIILYKTKHKDLLFCAGIFLLIVSFFHMGMYNDLCLRATIPSMFIFQMLFTQKLLDRETKKMWKIFLFCLIVVLTIPDAGVRFVGISKIGISNATRKAAYVDLADFQQEVGGSFVRFQYYNWDTDGVIKYIIRK